MCDSRAHFQTEVPKRAFELPLLAYSILAFSSRHLMVIAGTEDIVSATYYGQALRILIPILSGPVDALDENILAAIVLLRSYEEFSGMKQLRSLQIFTNVSVSDSDTGTHLHGSSGVLDSMSSFASKGGLGEAASWIVLREDIYFSMTRSQPLYLHLDNYKNSSSFDTTDAESIANRAVLLFAKVLMYAFHPGQHLSIDSWNRLDEEVESWYESRPWHSTPLWVDAPRPGVSAFPAIWLTRPAHVVGYQHYCLSRMLLAIFNPHLSKPGFDTLRKRIEADATIHDNLRLVLGLARSNSSVVGALFHASHILETCGAYLRDPAERKEAIDLLKYFESRAGWRTKHIIERLTTQWSSSADAGYFGCHSSQ